MIIPRNLIRMLLKTAPDVVYGGLGLHTKEDHITHEQLVFYAKVGLPSLLLSTRFAGADDIAERYSRRDSLGELYCSRQDFLAFPLRTTFFDP